MITKLKWYFYDKWLYNPYHSKKAIMYYYTYRVFRWLSRDKTNRREN